MLCWSGAGDRLALAAVSIINLRCAVVAAPSRRQRNPRRSGRKRLLPSWPGPTLDKSPMLWREWHFNRPSRLAWCVWITLLVLCGSMLAWGTYEAAVDGFGTGFPSGFHFALLLVLLFGFVIVSAMPPTSLAEERHGTLEVLLTTPLSTREIVVAKWWAVYRTVLVLALVPLYAATAFAVSIPDLPAWATGRVVDPPWVPLTVRDRIFAVIGSCADFLVSGAVLVSLGLLLATWVRRVGRAVVLSVIGCFLTGIGWIVLVESLFSIAGPMGTPDELQNARLLHDMALSLSLVFGCGRPLDVLLIGQQYSRTSAWFSVDIVILFKAAIAGLLLWLTIKTFDRSMGRVPE